MKFSHVNDKNKSTDSVFAALQAKNKGWVIPSCISSACQGIRKQFPIFLWYPSSTSVHLPLNHGVPWPPSFELYACWQELQKPIMITINCYDYSRVYKIKQTFRSLDRRSRFMKLLYLPVFSIFLLRSVDIEAKPRILVVRWLYFFGLLCGTTYTLLL